MDKDQEKKLIDAAIAASKRAYAPYSHFHVGAALLTREGKIIPGCNVENVSFGLTNCAERTALYSAIVQGYREYENIAIYVDSPGFISPCGACRQVLYELASDVQVILVNNKRQIKRTTVKKLLPLAFGIDELRSGQHED